LLENLSYSHEYKHFIPYAEIWQKHADIPLDASDTMLGHYLIATWAKICQAMGPEFEPYLPVVMPPVRSRTSRCTILVTILVTIHYTLFFFLFFVCTEDDVEKFEG
jgi:hypothetical protein